MSDLRKQLQSMRDQYRGEKYPGDLATEILSPPRRLPVGKIVAATSTLLALAAAVALFVSVVPAVVPPTVSPTPAGDAVAVIPMNEFEPMSVDATMPAFPADVSLIPASESITDIGAMPSIPSVDMNFSITDISEESA